ncbi:hypothetical protein DYQ86_11840 [Acidobacteria bacterium AB60]|nr:hypothetical protein DYQ86_11840 [Acidobacteria bacterium AB60]
MSYPLLKTAARAAAFVGLLLLSPGLAPAQNADSSDINQLLNEIKTHAVLAEDDAQTLDAYTRSNTSTESHADRLRQVKVHTNDLIEDFNRMKELRPFGSPWQQEAIDRIQPLLQQMSSHLRATLNYYKENRHLVQMPPYRSYIKSNRQYITRATRLISDFVAYGQARADMDALGKSLPLPTPATEIP